MLVENGMLDLKGVPVSLADWEAGAIFVGLVNEETSSVEAGLKCTDDSLVGMSNLELDFLVDFISYVVETFFDENNLVNVI